ncbi:MAG: outer membrane protein transport protein [bacterium]
MKIKQWLSYTLGVMIILASSEVFAAGFNILDHSARALGRGGAFTATADDSSAIYFNPAGLFEFEGWEVKSDFIYSIRKTKYTSLSGQSEKITNIKTTPNLFVVSDEFLDKWKFGIGVFVPFGSYTAWSETGPLRYQATYSELSMVDVNPTVCYKVNPQLSCAVGFNFYSAEVIQRRMRNFGIVDGTYRQESDTAYAYGYNLGILYKMNDKNRFGCSYRSPFTIEFEGTAKTTGIPGFITGSPEINLTAEATYDLPDEYMFGYARKINEKLEAEIDIQWTNWSRHKSVPVKFLEAPNFNTTIQKDFHDSVVLKLGVEYGLTENIDVRGGYAYSDAPTPTATFDPSNPDADRNSYYLGCGYEKGPFSVDFGATVTIFADRFVVNNVGASQDTSINGTYETYIPQFALGVSWMF